MRVLFLHVSAPDRSEYAVHTLLTRHADPARVDARFVLQEGAPAPDPSLDARTAVFDFGRARADDARVARWRRTADLTTRLPASLRFLRRHARATRPDALYTSQHGYELWMGALLARLLRLPHVVHVSYPVLPDHADRGGFQSRLFGPLIRRADLVVACSDFVRESLATVGVRPERLVRLHHGADVARYAVPRDPARLRARFGLPDDARTVTIAARLDRGKGYPALIDAFARLRRHRPEARLIACGAPHFDPSYAETLHALARDRGIADAVVWAGHRADLPEILADSDLFCMPTEDDALPLVFLAAMAAALPIVAYRSGGVPEMVADGESGLLADTGDVAGLAERMEAVLADPERARRLGEAARRRAFADFAPEAAAARWTELLEARVRVPHPAQGKARPAANAAP